MATESLTHPHHSFVREVDEEVVELVRARTTPKLNVRRMVLANDGTLLLSITRSRKI